MVAQEATVKELSVIRKSTCGQTFMRYKRPLKNYVKDDPCPTVFPLPGFSAEDAGLAMSL